MDVQAPEVLMSVRHIFLQLDQNAEEIVRPVQAPVDDWNFALAALAAMADDEPKYYVTFMDDLGKVHGVYVRAVDAVEAEEMAKQRMKDECAVRGWDYREFEVCNVEAEE